MNMKSYKYFFAILMIMLLTFLTSCTIKRISKPTKASYDRSMEYTKEGFKLLDDGDNEKAIDCFSKALDEYPNNDLAFNNRGNAYMNLGQYDKAIADYKAFMKVSPKDPLAYSNLSNAYLFLDDKKKALEYADKSIELDDKSNLSGYLTRSFIYLKLKKYEKSIEDSNKAIAINPDAIPAYVNRGLAYIETGKLEEGKQDIEKVLKSMPNLYSPYSVLGKYYEKKGNKKLAIEYYEKSLSLQKKKESMDESGKKFMLETENTIKQLKKR